MKQKLSKGAVSRLLCIGALAASTTLAFADTQITFSIDMTSRIGVDFNPATDKVAARGTFNGYGEFDLVQSNSSNIYTNTFDDVLDTNGAQMQYKYWTTVGSWESGNKANGSNRRELLPVLGGSLVLPVQSYIDSGPASAHNVTFQVDMSEQSELGTFNPSLGVVVTGSFNGWPNTGVTMVQDSSNTNIWKVTAPVNDAEGAFENYKFLAPPLTGWEGAYPAGDLNVDGDSGNRFFDNVDQTLPVAFFNDIPFSAFTVTNNVKFVTDMSVQVAGGAFTNGFSQVEIHGDFNNWASGVVLTNDSVIGPNAYSTILTYVTAPGANANYKYVMQPGTVWETLPNTDPAHNIAGGNRTFGIPHTSGSFTIGPDLFALMDSNSLPDFNSTPTLVTFSVNMSNIVVTNTSFDPAQVYPFDPSHQVFINGMANGNANSFWTWGIGNGGGYQMNQVGNSLIYSIAVLVNRGQPLNLTYKYSVDEADDEAGFGDNHIRYIRSLGSYTMPLDVFGSQGQSAQSEINFGNLTATKSGKNLSFTWLGRPGVHLQTATTLNGKASWTPDLTTDGTNLIVAPGGMASTNIPIGAGNKFFELVGPQ